VNPLYVSHLSQDPGYEHRCKEGQPANNQPVVRLGGISQASHGLDHLFLVKISLSLSRGAS
jgi:hypothetical protein